MNYLTRYTIPACLALAPAISLAADPPVDELARLTGAVIANVSTKLSEHQRETNAANQRRAQLIAVVVRQAAEGQQIIDNDLLVLKNTGGAETVKIFTAMREYGDQAALAPAQFEAAQAAALADATSAIKPLSLSTEKLDAAAKGLGQLGTFKTSKERLAFLRGYLHDTREQIKVLEDGAKKEAAKGDAALASAAKVTADSADKAKPAEKDKPVVKP
jgi:hypothetical protein